MSSRRGKGRTLRQSLLSPCNSHILSLAKKEELVYVMNRTKPLRLSRRSFALRLLQYVRDEAHRFAQHYHHELRRKNTFGE